MEDFTGVTFNDLVGIRPAEYVKGKGRMWLWKCICNQEIEIKPSRVKSGHDKSCGCRRSRDCDTIKLCVHCGEQSFRKNRHGNYASVCQACYNKQTNDFKYRNPRSWLVQTAKIRASKKGIPFDITEDDFEIPKKCPILGVTLTVGKKKFMATSPSLDRIVPELGYVKGNVAVISHRANAIKNNGTAEEHRRIADWMDAQLKLPEEVAA